MRPRKRDRDLPSCVYRKHGALWLVKRGRWTRLGDDGDLEAALAVYARLIDRPTGGMAPLLESTLKHLRPRVAASTYDSYRKAADKLAEVFAEFAPHQVQPRHVVQFQLAYAGTPNMANRMLSVLRQAFDLALRLEMIDANPCVGVNRLGERKRDRYLSDTELAAIRAKAGPRLQVVMDLLYCTAQRPVDVLKIREADIGEDGITFRQQKTGARLTVKWSPELRAAVDAARALYRVRGVYLVRGRAGKPADYRTVAQQWHDAVTAAGVPDAQLRDIRPKSITDADMQGRQAQALAGHATPAMTQRYIRRRRTPLVEGPSLRQPSKTA
jgi:integrase